MGEFGDRMKQYERVETSRRFLPLLPVCARLDGKGFSKYTKNFARPYDPRLSELMQQSTRRLVEATNACLGYTQSDEINLIWYSNSHKSQIFFDGRIQKMVSVLASMVTAYFNQLVPKYIAEKSDHPALFDSRVWQVPTLEEAANQVLWRELDATKNSISMAARHYYSHNELHKKTGSQMQEMLFAKGVNWNDYPPFFKRGSFFQRQSVTRAFTSDELEQLPEQHEARKDPDLTVERSEVRLLEMPPFSKVTNRVEVIFAGAQPQVEEASTP